jgi:hypothetical protein
MKTSLALNKMRFVSCANGVRLLQNLPEAIRRAVAGNVCDVFCAGLRFDDDFTSVPMTKINLKRDGIFRGRISPRKNQTNQINQPDLEERTLPAPKK